MNRLRPVSLFLVVLLYAVCAFSQEPRVPPGFTEDNTENILITTKNFDEISFPDDNSIMISPNRYANVSFYAAGTNTWLTHLRALSYPNSLIVGIVSQFPDPGGTYPIFSVNNLVIDFARPSQDVSFWWGRDGTYSSGTIQIYDENLQLVTTLPVNLPGSWVGFSLNPYHQRIKRVILRRPNVPDNRYGHIHLDNFQFTPILTQSPVGNLESVSIEQGAALGWSADPDSPSASNLVHCYIDAQFAGATTANLPGSAGGYPGNHRFSFPIPIQYRDGIDHQIVCYGIDISGGDSPGLLTGSPRIFRFNAPVGVFESINADGEAVGWSVDPDVPTLPNIIHFYVDGPAGSGGVYVGEAPADQPHANTGYPGNHGFKFSIPPQYRDNQQHALYAYGLDLTGDNSKPLSGNPKPFNLTPVVISTVFIPLAGSPLTPNNNAGGGLRMFPERATPSGPVMDRVNVKAKISTSVAGVPVYFSSFDLDDPSSNTLPVDDETLEYDNRVIFHIGDLCPDLNCDFDDVAQAYKVFTDSNGEATMTFQLVGAHPGDNYAISATTRQNETPQIDVDGISLRNSVTGRVLQENVDRTPMLTAWRTLHIEVDSMGTVQNNLWRVSTTDQYIVGQSHVTIPLRSTIESRRFENGRMQLSGNSLLNIAHNNSTSLTVFSSAGTQTVQPYYLYTIYDDDDFNSDNSINGFDADNGEDVVALADSFDLLQPNDDTNCGDGICNVYAPAYIQPEYVWASQYNTSNIGFVSNIPFDFGQLQGQIDRGRDSLAENDAFWIAYVQIAYQGAVDIDCDMDSEDCLGGATPSSIFFVDDVSNEAQVPEGSHGSLAFVEVMRDFDAHRSGDYRIRAAPHEIGHQFGIKGDSMSTDFRLMNASGGLNFVDRHLNMIRWRRKSPGVPRN